MKLGALLVFHHGHGTRSADLHECSKFKTHIDGKLNARLTATILYI